jgi:hypothetical protein
MAGANVVAYKAEAARGAVNICHCHDCQTLSVAAFRAPSSRRLVSWLSVKCALLAKDVRLVDFLGQSFAAISSKPTDTDSSP